MFRSFRQLVSAIAAKQRVVITVDDLQWADADSFLLLRELLGGNEAPNVLVVATARHVDAPDTMPVEGIAEELADIAMKRTDLARLSEDESRLLAERLAPQLAGKVDIARITREAGGHPMFLAEILRHIDSLGNDAATATLDAALTSRVALLAAEARGLRNLGIRVPLKMAALLLPQSI